MCIVEMSEYRDTIFSSYRPALFTLLSDHGGKALRMGRSAVDRRILSPKLKLVPAHLLCDWLIVGGGGWGFI